MLPTRLTRTAGRALIAASVTFGSLGLVATTGSVAPAAAATSARDGVSAQTAGVSCYSIKQSFPASADGVYWLWTPKLGNPQQFYCDMTTDGGGWVLVGRGREGWSFPYWGQDSPSNLRTTVTGTGAFAPAALPTPTIDGLLNGGRVDALADGIRLRRAADVNGTTWQEVRMNASAYGSWSWAFGGGIPLSGVKFDAETATFSSSYYQTNTTANVQIANDLRRVNTVPQSSHNYQGGFAYGATATGQNTPTSYLWQYASEGNAIPFTQVFIRPQITETDIVNAGVTHAPDTGVAATTVRKLLDRNPTSQPWAVTGINVGTAVSNMNDYVKSFAQIGNTIYMGGKFLQVQHGIGGPTYTQSYLAAFDATTGEWIPTFTPIIDAPVWKLAASPDGTKLFVGGEFTNVNGVANTTALAALDPTTGAPVPATSWSAYASRPTGSYDIRAMSIQGPWLYLGGNFTKITGGTGTNVVGPLTLSRLARVRLSDGRPDWNWEPTLDTAPMDLLASTVGDRVYLVGAFSTLNGVTLNPNHQAVIDTTTGAAVPGLKAWQPTQPGVTEPSNTVLENGNHVYLGGSQHYLHSYSRSDYTLERARITQNAGGDFQAMAMKDGVLYASCHCVTDWQFEDTLTYPQPQGYSRVDPINLIGAYDTTANLEVIPEFHPTKLKLKGSGGEGPWSLFVDNSGCMWAGGDLLRPGATAAAYYGGYEKFCDRDTQAPATPPNVRATTSANAVTLTWNATTDNSTDPIQYEILRDDPTLGTIVEGVTYNRSWTDQNVYGAQRYFVRALDATGNRSATTPVIAVTTPPPTLATLVATGASWSYRADGQNLGTAWRLPATDTSAWPTGTSQLGWGAKGEATTIPSGPITSYFVKHITVADPAPYKTLTVRLKRDDGAAVYLNGVEIVRDNLPAGAVTALTPASGYTSGAAESTWYEFTVPASLVRAGDNTLAAELHQADANNVDGVFDLELLARGALEANPPSTPAVTVGSVDFASVALNWPAATDDTAVAGYLVRRDGTPIAWTGSTTFTDRGLTPATAYAYDVVAMDSSGNVSVPGTTSVTTGANPTLVQSGDAWSYRSDGTDLGSAWRQPGYDATSWASGPSQLGWGAKGEVTALPTGQITQYLRRHFTVADAADVQQLALRLKRDDAAVVYLNGVEVLRSNLPAGPITATTYASTTVSAAQSNTWYDSAIPGALLTTGDNVIAVELHQDSKTDTHAAFDLQLTRQTPAETNPPTRPTVHQVDRTDTSITIDWSGATDDTGVVGYLVRRNGVAVTYTTATTFADTGLTPKSPYAYQVLAVDAAGNLSTPGQLAAATMDSIVLSATGDTWAYRADGVDQGSAWRQPGFDTTGWSTGPSQLGWGGKGEATVVPSGQITQYFVRHVAAPAPGSVDQYVLRVKRDDGIAVYVNGTEVVRDNLPTGPLTAATYAVTPVTGSLGTTWLDFVLPASALTLGDNVIAAEVHQDSKTDTHAVFDLDLRAVASSSAPIVTVTTPTANGFLHTNPATITGLCTTADGTVTATVTGTATVTLTSACVSNEWSVTTPLTDGAHSVTATQTDPAAVTGTSPATAFTVDTVAPVVTLDTPTPGTASTTAAMSFAGTCSTGEGAVTVRITGTAASTQTTPCVAGAFTTTATLATGSFSATAAQTDPAGNTATTAAVPFTVDTTAPVTTDSTASIGAGWKNSAQIVTLNASDTGSGVAATYFTTDGSTPTTGSTSGTTIPLATEGTFTIKYFSVDHAGNVEAVKTAATPVKIDLTGPATTDTSAAIGTAWKNTPQTVTLTPTDAGGSGIAATYFTTDGSTPTVASTKGTTVTLSASGVYTVKYFSVDNAGNVEPVQTAGTVIRIDRQNPVTGDNTQLIGNTWKTTPQTVTLTPGDTGGSGVVTTYYTINGSTPTVASAQGTSVLLPGPGTYSVKYFSVDAAGNTETVKTASTPIRIDAVAPTAVTSFPANNATYNATRWSAGCSGSNRVCGTAADTTSGVATVRVTIQRNSDATYWNGVSWVAAATPLTPTGTTSWYVPLATSGLTSGVSYSVTTVATDNAGNVTTTATNTFTYDTTAPTITGVAATNHSGAVQTGDTVTVTFSEALDPTKVPATGTLTLQRGRNGSTTWGVSGLTSGQQTTGATGYLRQPPNFQTFTVTYAGALALSNGNQTITFTVTGGCAGSCSSLSTNPVSGPWTYAPNTSLVDAAGNTVVGTLNGAFGAMF